MHHYILIAFVLLWTAMANAQQRTIRGSVVSSVDHTAIKGVSVYIKGKRQGVSTRENGGFSIAIADNDTLLFSATGYQRQQWVPPIPATIRIELVPTITELEEVIVSTGYQALPKERTTGSFVQVDNSLLNRGVSVGIIDRLQDLVPGLSFNKVGSSELSVRGQSTLFGNAEPLIVIDNFPFEGNLLDINPNDVESITVLKDAAAASIWGARAGNGVIVITTKKAAAGQPIKVDFTGNVTVGQKPDLFVNSVLSTRDYIDIEKQLFERGYFQSRETTGYQPLTPVVELLYEKQRHPDRSGAIDAEIEKLTQYDIRKDMEKYLYRNSINQQYAANITGGSRTHRYMVSTGLDRNNDVLVGNYYQRFTANASNHFSWLDGRLSLSTALYFVGNLTDNSNDLPAMIQSSAGLAGYPYARLVDEDGQSAAIVKDYRPSFIQTAVQDGLLDWDFVPLDELGRKQRLQKRNNLRMNLGLDYRLADGLNWSNRYQYTDIQALGRVHAAENAYFSRDLINRFTQVNEGVVVRPIPSGGILDLSRQATSDQTFRSQLNYSKTYSGKHDINLLAGFEIREARTEGKSLRYYGYDSEYELVGYVDYTDDQLPYYYDNARRGSIPRNDQSSRYTDRYRSYYANASYTYANIWTVTGSARLDQSNLFGVRTNQRGVPLWSAGVGWNISRQQGYEWGWLPFLKLRASFGYNGSVNKSVSAYTTAAYSGVNIYQRPFSTIVNPPNPDLRWERVKIANIGVDFASAGHVISGSIEYFHKEGLDLIGDMPMPPSSGITLFRGNTANTVGHGWDVQLNSRNLNGVLHWNTDLNLSFLLEKVTDYNVEAPVNGSGGYIQGILTLPLKGYPLYGLYGYQWGGLDPENGNPKGYVGNELSTDYRAIINETTKESMVYGGSLRPTVFGAVRNTFLYGRFDVSFNVAFSFGHFFRKQTLSYGNNLGLVSNHGDYALRWQQPGDEQHTIVPSVPTATNGNRDTYYRYSEALIDRASNIRLRDVRLAYTIGEGLWPAWAFRNLQCYLYATDLALLWKATRFDIDPEYQNSRPPINVALGLKFTIE